MYLKTNLFFQLKKGVKTSRFKAAITRKPSIYDSKITAIHSPPTLCKYIKQQTLIKQNTYLVLYFCTIYRFLIKTCFSR